MVTWDPYSIIRSDEDVAESAFYKGTIKYFGIVESYNPDRFLQQMGHVQGIHKKPYTPIRAQRGKAAQSYVVKYSFQPENWESWQDHLLAARSRGPRETVPWDTTDDYMAWFNDISHPFIENPERNTIGDENVDIYDRVRQVIDVIKAWKALPPRESDKAAAVKMADEALKLLTMFGSPTPSQSNSTPAEIASSSKRKPTTSAPSPSQQKGKKARK
ncbi:hypothetical protein Scep_028448 [Stephania cephalantha]|uniref:Uncharacterized protein n=1 Tax=Stephania cephalantha TaxID=152367 RepID=A0AAP0E9Z5_9MAGN